MKAVILAGGMGTRLRPLTYTRPKSMLPIANKPILQYIIESLSKQEFDEIIITLNYLSNQIREYFKDGSDFGVKIIYSEEEVPLGTAGGVKKAEKYLNETFAVIQGDNITEIDFREIVQFHLRKKSIVTIAVKHVSDPWMFGVVMLDKEGRITHFLEKPKPENCFSNLINTGLYVLDPSVLDYIPSGKPYDFSINLFPELLGKVPMFGYKTRKFWVDVGNPEGYMKACKWVLRKIAKKISSTAEISSSVNLKGRIWVDEFVIIRPGVKIRGPVMIGKNSIIEREAEIEQNSVIGEEVRIGAQSHITNSVIYERTTLGMRNLLQNCVVGENCEIEDDVKIEGLSLIGANCTIGRKTRILANSRIWPGLNLPPEKTFSGIVCTT